MRVKCERETETGLSVDRRDRVDGRIECKTS
jgi:hypothetical protein